MSKLHFYKGINKEADGDGTVEKSEEFEVSITWGEVKKGHTYEIRQGQKPSGDSYNCKAGATKGGKAKFQKALLEQKGYD